MSPIATPSAPAAVGPYSQAIDTGALVFISGQLPIDPATSAIPDGAVAQAAQAFANVRAILETASGVTVVDDPEAKRYPMPIDATEEYDVLAGRIRQDISRIDKRGLEMFVSGDQLLKGAALNAVQIAEHL